MPHMMALERRPFSLITLPVTNFYLPQEANRKEENNLCLLSSALEKVRGGVLEDLVLQSKDELMKNGFGGEVIRKLLRTAVLSSTDFDGSHC